MTYDLNALRADYTTLYKTLMAERRMREHVFRADAEKRAAKLQEIDNALAGLERMKTAHKAMLEAAGHSEAAQPTLFGGGE
jgi:hypothetical protein